MKKFFTLVAMAMMAVGMNAQKLIAENDFTGGFEGDYPYWYQFDASQTDGSVASDPEGVAITVGIQTGQLWQPQVMVIPDGGVSLEEDGNYKVVLVAKFPGNGTLQVNMGSWSGADQYTVPIEATGDFQTVEVEFPAYAYTTINQETGAPNGHVLFQCGDFKGTTILKKVQVYDLDDTGTPEPGEAVIAEKDFTGGFEGDYPYWYQFDASQTDGSVASDPDGVAITVGTQTGQLWQPQVMVIPDGEVYLEEDGNYKVVLVAKFPCDGTLQVNMGSWSGADQYTVDIVSTGDFQTVEVEFPAYAYTTINQETGAPNGHVLFQCGDFKGTTILKSVKVINLDGATGIAAVKAEKADGAIFNLAGQKVNANYKGVVIQNGKKFIQK